MNTDRKPHGAGKSTFELVNPDLILRSLSLTPSTVLLDLGCGKGDYTVAMAKSIGMQGIVYAIDAWQAGLEELQRRALSEGLVNIITIQADLNEHIPLENATVDVCFMASVLHDLLRESSGEVVLSEIVRVLRPAGRLFIVEFKKIENSPGPPLSLRLSPEETEKIIAPFGFLKDQITDAGPFHYLLTASLAQR